MGVFALGAVAETPCQHFRRRGLDVILLFAAIFLVVLIGLRYQVGGDWGAYLRQFQYFAFADIWHIFDRGDPAYHLLSWIANQLGFGIWFVNLICATIFAIGLHRLALTQPSPWLTFVVAIPYLVIVVAMGYTRQGVAIGVLMAGLARFQVNGSVIRFAVYVGIAALFHRTAVVALPLVALGGRRNAKINLLIAVTATATLYDALVAPEMDRFVTNYVKTELGSQGAAIRVAMSVVPAAIFISVKDRLGFTLRELSMWRNFAFASFVALVGLGLFTSTVVDRLALYLLPLQLAVIPRLSGVIGSRSSGKALVIVYAASIEFTWLNFGNFANYWIPYHFYPFAS